MKTKTFVVLSTLLLLMTFIFTGCKNKSVSIKQLENDLSILEEIQTCFSSEFANQSPYEINTFEIEKEQIDAENKQDIIYCNLNITNKYFSIDLYTCCTYSYYDKGGWILDDFDILEKSVSPIGAADGQMLIDEVLSQSKDTKYADRTAISCYYNEDDKTLRHGTLSLVNSELTDDNSKTLITVSYKSKVIEVDGYYSLIFDDTDGWVIDDKNNIDGKITMQVNSFTSDYSTATGNFKTVPFGGMNITGYDLNVVQISNDTISYSIKIDGYESYEYLDTTFLTDDFDPLTGTVALRSGKYSMFGYEIDYPAGTYIYNSIDDRWDSSSGANYPDTYSSNQIFAPRQLGRE